MNPKTYEIVLQTNDEMKHTYNIRAFSKEQAIILAQAEAIKNARGFELVSAKVIH